ncbi:MAG: arginine deiminase family protein [Microscillaceae bacterium]
MKPKTAQEKTLCVGSEIGRLRRLMIHNPDNGLAKVIPSKAQDWLFEDIIHLDTMRRHEYDHYVKLLLYFLDAEKVRGKLADIDQPEKNRAFYEPDQPEYFCSNKVIDPQYLLSEILNDRELRIKIVASICAVEESPYQLLDELLRLESKVLARTLISGVMPEGSIIFPPVPNFIFTRDIGIVINDHILLNRPAKVVRFRESLIMKYIFYNHPYFKEYQDKIIELADDEHQYFMSDEEEEAHQITLEGGDVMVVNKHHVVIGRSERTSYKAVNKVIKTLFDLNLVRKVSVIKIPKKRDFMHIDTIFTQVKRNVWVLFGALSRQNKYYEKQDFIKDSASPGYDDTHRPQIIQFHKGRTNQPVYFEYLEDLLDDISQNDCQSEAPTRFIYSGNAEFPFGLREQWTDSCNVLALREGVVIGYDRNNKTAEAFQKEGFEVISAPELIQQFEQGERKPDLVRDTLILLPSAELSRARGGSHCMSMPLWREELE